MSILDDILTSTKETISERLSSPLLSSFAIAWSLWNYKFLVILFSSAGVTQTFTLIDQIAFPDKYTLIVHGCVLPLVSALAYVFIYPYPAKIIYEFTLNRQREINQIKRNIDEETLLSLQESRKIRADHVASERKYLAEIDNLNNEIARLTSALDQLADPQKIAVNEKNRETPDDRSLPRLRQSSQSISEAEIKLLAWLAKYGPQNVEAEILSSYGKPRIETEFELGELVNKKLVSRDYSRAKQDYVYEFTHEGRRTLINSFPPDPSAS